MSEYQYVHFLAIDRPLDDKQLTFMRKQSSRAEVTRWEFTNEYHFGDFRGNAEEMLRRGYDVHLHYANFGLRKLMIRLPAGLPCDRKTFEAFQIKYGIRWIADKQGKGGILEIQPECDADSYSEEWYDAGHLLPEMAPLRELLAGGDLRPLYIAWLACCHDEEASEPPVPAGLDKLSAALDALAGFYEVSPHLLAAAARLSPALPPATDAGKVLERWIDRQSPDDLRQLVRRFLSDDAAVSRAKTMAHIRDEMEAAPWPSAKPARTLAQLKEMAEEIAGQHKRHEQETREAARRKRLANMAADPEKTIAHVEALVKQRSVADYQAAAEELSELREALGPVKGPKRATAAAEKLRRENPRRSGLVGALRKRGLLG
jgi:hypothetical protein